MKDMLNNSFANSSWNKENNPKIVLRKYFKIHQKFEIDRIFINILLTTSWCMN
ncbi:cephalosporin hydroxylase family protein [Candidatus Pelagibacter sp.]|nr:cephalosporin hydroxylase family protein [Candidatus Pelagibacter sp.]